jgi:hypothetical protein
VTYNILGISEIELFGYTLTFCGGRLHDNFMDPRSGAICEAIMLCDSDYGKCLCMPSLLV